MNDLRRSSVWVLFALSWGISCGDVRREPITAPITAPMGSGGSPGESCASDADCGADVPRCDLASGACVECLDTSDCPGASCRGVSGCSRPEAILCDPTRHRCAECVTDGHCASVGERCSAVLGVCATPCTTAASCPGDESICDAVTGFCVECVGDADCDSRAPYCRLGECTR